MEMGLRSAGTAEFAGLEAPPDYRRAQIFKRLTKRLVPGLNTNDCEEWMGIRPSFPDSLPCLGEIPGQPGLYAAFGHAHCGLMMAPMTGRVVADLVTGATPNLDLAPYGVERFGG
jgi:D-amino-acid dehydrogenase